ncbi:uncharacterized protein LOC128983683 isoform X2 [Macrosteles quadrilineatus]|uniref:uncharacterized protein LOC128983683 isoform X2 n=1 Tax=Macrosteles quadrilineatus TaxID=74068 RepID=UPI0023E15695|nr:uncharacterized protein LOC128983683 isoform X2 [Macrosteles quadrilineatus]
MFQPEDEWKEMQQRFRKEGLDFEALKAEDRLLQVWRWLVDAESNLKNSRRMLDKLHEQQNEEIEEMESYMGHIRDMAVKRADSLQFETVELRTQIDNILKLIANAKLPPGSLDHQVSNLITEKSRLEEELDILKKLKISSNGNGSSGESELLNEIIKVSSEKEVLKRQLSEMTDRVDILEKATKQIELDNERLAFKLSEALAELEEKEAQMGEQPLLWHNIRSNESSRSSFNKRDLQRTSLEPSEPETREVSTRDQRESHHSLGADSTPPSLLVSELASFGSPRKLSSLLDSCNELARAEEVKRLQSENDSIRSQLMLLGEKYNALVLRHIQYKSKHKFTVEELRGRLDAGQCQVQTLQAQLSVQRQRLRAEEMFRKQVETDYRRLQEEKRNIASRLLSTEVQSREEVRELAVLRRKTQALEQSNADLLSRMLRAHYKDNLPKSHTLDDIGPHLFSM